MAKGWRALASCFGLPTDYFFDATNTAAAKEVCAICPVRQECRDECDEMEERLSDQYKHNYGIYGGETPNERKARRRNGTRH
jgi:hypothetical protein